MSDDPPGGRSLSALLEVHAESVLRLVRREGRGLLRFESEEDLAQGACARILASQGQFVWAGEEQAFAFMATLARRHIADRHAWWSTLRRGSGRLVRLTWSGTEPGNPIDRLVPTRTGAATIAARKEQIVWVTRALAALPERDQRLVRWASEQEPIAEQAKALGISYEAAQRAGLRAIERLRKTVRLLSSRGADSRG